MTCMPKDEGLCVVAKAGKHSGPLIPVNSPNVLMFTQAERVSRPGNPYTDYMRKDSNNLSICTRHEPCPRAEKWACISVV